MVSTSGDSTIHQLQLEAVKRYSKGLTFQVEYSWNRSLDDTPISGGPENPYDNARDKGNSEQIRRHIFTAAYGYELPFGPGKRWANVKGLAGHLIGGWQLAGITYLRTGTPFSVSFNISVAGWAGGRADVIGNPTLGRGERNEYRWFDPAAFMVPQQFTYGNSARNLLFTPATLSLTRAYSRTRGSPIAIRCSSASNRSICRTMRTLGRRARTFPCPARWAESRASAIPARSNLARSSSFNPVTQSCAASALGPGPIIGDKHHQCEDMRSVSEISKNSRPNAACRVTTPRSVAGFSASCSETEKGLPV